MCACALWRSEEDGESSRTEIMYGFETPCEDWEQKLGPPYEQQMLLTT